MESIDRFLKDPKQSFFLFGPRGTGKSWWIRQRFPDALCLDLLDPEVFRIYSAKPERLRAWIEGQAKKEVIVIDEVQKIPALLDVVHQLMEEKKGWRFILTGSSARKLKREGVDLLAGRAVKKDLHPFLAAELGSHFNMEKALSCGLLPLVWGSANPEEVLNTYHSLYLREEVQLEGLVRNIGSFNRFLEAISFSHANVLNISNVARECEVERKTANGYVEILEDLLLGCRLPVFTKRAKREMAVQPKFYLFDAGVFRSLRPKGPLDKVTEMEGACLEGLVFQHLRGWVAYRGKQNNLYYWRTRSNVEVDFVCYGEDGLYALEVKNAKKIHPQDLRPLKAFQADYPESQAVLIYRGRERLKMGKILCIPGEEFLQHLHPAKRLLEFAN